MKKDISQIAFLVQARLSSQRCPRKMIRPFADTTLLDINIQKLVESKFIPNENIYVSVYEDELKRALDEDGQRTSTYITPQSFYPSGI